ncbi:MAG: hypothetical protein K2H01_03120 [Ruminococcus sp.]|nr:hypothetical protein [Ruminococcus sp.]
MDDNKIQNKRAKENFEHYQECKKSVLDGLYDYFFEISKDPPYRTSEVVAVVAVAKLLLDEYKEETEW